MSEEVNISFGEEEQDAEKKIQPSHEDTTPHKDHGLSKGDVDLLKDLEKQEAETTSTDHQASQKDRRKVQTSIEAEEQDEENEIQPSHEDTTPHKDHGFTEIAEDLLKDLKTLQEVNTTSTDAGQNDGQKNRTKIQKVPKIMNQREQTQQYFTPSEISIGPVHAKTNQLIQRDLKLRLAVNFLEQSKETARTLPGNVKDDIARKLLGNVKEDIAKLKECYDKTVVKPFDDDQLASILFLDGCFVLQFIHGLVFNNLNEFEISNGQSRSIQNDLFLLENQVPFQLLKLLINSSNKNRDLRFVTITHFIAEHTMSPRDYYWRRYYKNWLRKPGENKEPLHLLDLLRSELLFDSCVKNNNKTTDGLNLQQPKEPLHSFRNVQDLKATGIKFKPSKISSFRAVSFSTWWCIMGWLSLPPMIVDNSTASKLWNLVAYEMCPDNYNCDFGVSSYLSLLDSLVDNEQDVRDLRVAHVLMNRLSSDKDVARLFNTIGSNLVSKDAYLDVKAKIQRHYKRKCASWVAQVCRDHFSNPKTVFALFAATVALILTGFSTWFTVYPNPKK